MILTYSLRKLKNQREINSFERMFVYQTRMRDRKLQFFAPKKLKFFRKRFEKILFRTLSETFNS